MGRDTQDSEGRVLIDEGAPAAPKALARLARQAARMRWGPEDSGSAPTLPGKEPAARDAATGRLSGDAERAVLKALDPFWTRGIVKPGEGEE